MHSQTEGTVVISFHWTIAQCPYFNFGKMRHVVPFPKSGHILCDWITNMTFEIKRIPSQYSGLTSKCVYFRY